MHLRRAKFLLTILAIFLLSSCGAPRPIKYYALSVPQAPAQQSSAKLAIVLLVGRPIASHLYRDNRLIYGSGPVQLGAYDDERWAETPVDMIQDMLVSKLRETGEYRSVSRIGSNVRGGHLLRSRLNSLSEVDRPQLLARVSLDVELFDLSSRTTVWSDSYAHDEPVNGKSVPDVVEALGRNVNTGISQIVENLGQYFASHPPQATAQPAR